MEGVCVVALKRLLRLVDSSSPNLSIHHSYLGKNDHLKQSSSLNYIKSIHEPSPCLNVMLSVYRVREK